MTVPTWLRRRRPVPAASRPESEQERHVRRLEDALRDKEGRK